MKTLFYLIVVVTILLSVFNTQIHGHEIVNPTSFQTFTKKALDKLLPTKVKRGYKARYFFRQIEKLLANAIEEFGDENDNGELGLDEPSVLYLLKATHLRAMKIATEDNFDSMADRREIVYGVARLIFNIKPEEPLSCPREDTKRTIYSIPVPQSQIPAPIEITTQLKARENVVNDLKTLGVKNAASIVQPPKGVTVDQILAAEAAGKSNPAQLRVLHIEPRQSAFTKVEESRRKPSPREEIKRKEPRREEPLRDESKRKQSLEEESNSVESQVDNLLHSLAKSRGLNLNQFAQRDNEYKEKDLFLSYFLAQSLGFNRFGKKSLISDNIEESKIKVSTFHKLHQFYLKELKESQRKRDSNNENNKNRIHPTNYKRARRILRLILAEVVNFKKDQSKDEQKYLSFEEFRQIVLNVRIAVKSLDNDQLKDYLKDRIRRSHTSNHYYTKD